MNKHNVEFSIHSPEEPGQMLISQPCKFDVNLLKLMESHSIYSEMRSASGCRLTQLPRGYAELLWKALLCAEKRWWIWLAVAGREILLTLTQCSEDLSVWDASEFSSSLTIVYIQNCCFSVWLNFLWKVAIAVISLPQLVSTEGREGLTWKGIYFT